MLKNISIGKYISGSSVIHKLDVKTKFFIFLILTILVFCTKNIISLLIILVSCILIIKFSKFSLLKFIKNNLYILGFSLVMSLLNIFFEISSNFFIKGKLFISLKAVYLSIMTFFKFLCLIFISSSVMLTTSPSEMAYGVEKILSPINILGLNSRDIGLTVNITLRFIPIVLEEIFKIYNAQKCRGANFKNKNLFKNLKVILSIIIPLFVSSFNKANDIAIALESRCYDSNSKHTEFKLNKFKKIDYITLIFLSIISLGVILCTVFKI